MLEYTKIILSKVSFDPGLFRRELQKALRNLPREEFAQLEEWCRHQFGEEYCLTRHRQSA